MVKTASRTQENGVRQISSPASMVTVSRLPGSVMATTTVRIILMNWREFVVRLNAQLKLKQMYVVTSDIWFIYYYFSHFLFALI